MGGLPDISREVVVVPIDDTILRSASGALRVSNYCVHHRIVVRALRC